MIGWLPKLSLGRELWSGGPSLREAFEAQLSPDGKAGSSKPAAESPAVQMLLLLR